MLVGDKMEQNIAMTAATQAQVDAIWWALNYIILPAIVGGYLFTLGIGKWIIDRASNSQEKIWAAIQDVRVNELKHIAKDVAELKSRVDRLRR